jgi:hypothetical protein
MCIFSFIVVRVVPITTLSREGRVSLCKWSARSVRVDANDSGWGDGRRWGAQGG